MRVDAEPSLLNTQRVRPRRQQSEGEPAIGRRARLPLESLFGAGHGYGSVRYDAAARVHNGPCQGRCGLHLGVCDSAERHCGQTGNRHRKQEVTKGRNWSCCRSSAHTHPPLENQSLPNRLIIRPNLGFVRRLYGQYGNQLHAHDVIPV